MPKKLIAGVISAILALTSVTAYAASMPSSGTTMIQPNKLTIKWADGSRDPVTIDTFRFYGYNVAQLRTMVAALGGAVVQLSGSTYQIAASGSQVSFTPIGFSNAGNVNYILNQTQIVDKNGAPVTPSEPGWVYLTEYGYNWASVRDVANALGFDLSDVQDDPVNGATVVTVRMTQAAPSATPMPTATPAPTATPTPTAAPILQTATPTPTPVSSSSSTAPLAPGGMSFFPSAPTQAPQPSQNSQTYQNLYTALQGETNANAKYTAFAAKAKDEGYTAIANLFTVTADAEKLHANNEWILLQNMGAVNRPTAETPTVGTTAQNLQAAIAGETYEATQMYPGFKSIAASEGFADAAAIFGRTGQAEQIHANNYADALNNINDAAYLSKYTMLYRCPVCGAIFTKDDLPSAACPVCRTGADDFVQYNFSAKQNTQTYANLYTALQGETNAYAKYTAFAEKAMAEGYPAVANLFTATAGAEKGHGDAEWIFLQNMGATDRPTAQPFTVGNTVENLQAAIAGETYEYTHMYPDFKAAATAEGLAAEARILGRNGEVEQIHATNYQDALNNFKNADYLSKYLTIYRCPVCGAIFASTDLPSDKCPVCGTAPDDFVKYGNLNQSSQTYANLYAALQGETNARAKYLAFADQARTEGYEAVGNLFAATADAELWHANNEWTLLRQMGAVTRPEAQPANVGTTAQNLQAAIDGETYETTQMYPGFQSTAASEGYTDAVGIFERTGEAEQIHANNYQDALTNLNNADYLSKYLTIYRCPVCGAVFSKTDLPAAACPVCNTPPRQFAQYTRPVNPSDAGSQTYANLYAALQGETNASAKYLAFADKARAEGYETIANLFAVTADAESLHAGYEWGMLQNMGATDRPKVQNFTVGTTAQNLQAAIDGETYEYTSMYPGFQATATAEGYTDAASKFGRIGGAEQVHAGNYADALANLNNAEYLAKYAVTYRCPVCGSVFASTDMPSEKCPVCSAVINLFLQYGGSPLAGAQTYANLYAALQGETNANAKYTAFAKQALAEGYPAVANLFATTADAEKSHADNEWILLRNMGATDRPAVQGFTVGTTAQNLQAAIDGETYEYTQMYPGFAAAATSEGYADAADIFTRTGKAEQIHAGNYTDALNNLNNADYLSKYLISYRCPVCGSVFSSVDAPTANCPVCGVSAKQLIMYSLTTSQNNLKASQNSQTYANLYTALQGETNAHAKYLAFADKARAEGYAAVANLFTVTADAEQLHADSEWILLQGMGATDRPTAQDPTVGTTAQNLQAAIDGESYESATMYPDFSTAAAAEGLAYAADILSRTGKAEQVHANNYTDALQNLRSTSYMSKYLTLYRCQVCGAIFTPANVPASECTVCGTVADTFIVYKR